MENTRRPFRVWPYIVVLAFVLIAAFVLFVFRRARTIDDFTRGWVVRELSVRFDSQVELQSLHVAAFPNMGVTGEGLALHYKNHTGAPPPLIRIARFSFNLGVLGIVRAPRHIRGIHVEGMVITIPPRGEKKEKPPEEARKLRNLPAIIVDEIVSGDTHLIILPKKQGKEPLVFDIHDLVLKSVGRNKPFDFRGSLTNAKPKGEIATKGSFGPWDADEPGDSPVSGVYQFTDADLGPFPGIAGILSSIGNYSGQLNNLQVEGQTDTPDFSLDPVGHAVPLHTEFSATVDGTNGDTFLHPVRATLWHSLIIANGSVVRSLEKKGHVIALDVIAPNARLEDLMRLATKSNQPMMTGAVKLKTKFLLPPGKQAVITRLILDGDFGVEDAQFASQQIRQKLESLSRHAQGEPDNPDVGSAVSDLRGHFHLTQGLITFKDLTFSLPGAAIRLDGTYKLHGEELDFRGNLRMRAKLSQTVTGKKSILLKLVDPFFKKNGAGAEIPIRITGTRNNPEFGVALF
jgi:AsmA-like C-terminal region